MMKRRNRYEERNLHMYVIHAYDTIYIFNFFNICDKISV